MTTLSAGQAPRSLWGPVVEAYLKERGVMARMASVGTLTAKVTATGRRVPQRTPE